MRMMVETRREFVRDHLSDLFSFVLAIHSVIIMGTLKVKSSQIPKQQHPHDRSRKRNIAHIFLRVRVPPDVLILSV